MPDTRDDPYPTLWAEAESLSEPAKGTPLLTVVLIGLFWGLNWPAVKYMLTEMPPMTIRAMAFPVAAICLAAIAWGRGLQLRPEPHEFWPMIITGLLVVCGFNVLTALGQMYTETSKAAIIAYTMPALTAGFAALFLGERLGKLRVIALGVGMAGLAVLASEDLSALVAEPLGPVIMLLAALSWALGNVALKARQWSLPTLSLTVWFFVASSLFIWPLVLVFEPPWQQTVPSTPVLLTLIYHALGPMVVCYALWTALVGRLSASVAAITSLLAPVVGVLSAVVFLGDVVTWQKVIALGMILLSIKLAIAPQAEDIGKPVKSEP